MLAKPNNAKKRASTIGKSLKLSTRTLCNMEARPIYALKAAQIPQNWKKTSKRNCSEIMQKVP